MGRFFGLRPLNDARPPGPLASDPEGVEGVPFRRAPAGTGQASSFQLRAFISSILPNPSLHPSHPGFQDDVGSTLLPIYASTHLLTSPKLRSVTQSGTQQ